MKVSQLLVQKIKYMFSNKKTKQDVFLHHQHQHMYFLICCYSNCMYWNSAVIAYRFLVAPLARCEVQLK